MTRTGKTVVSIMAVLAVLAGTFMVWKTIWHQVRPDGGVAVCKAIYDGDKVGAKSGNDNAKMSEKEYRELRALFQGSRDEEIRQHGTAFVDAVWQVSNIKEGEEMGALAFIGTLTSSYAGLTGACAKHGYPLPPLGSGSTGKAEG